VQYACMQCTRAICMYAVQISEYVFCMYTYRICMCIADIHTHVCIFVYKFVYNIESICAVCI